MASKNPAIKRIQADIREMSASKNDQYYAEPLQDNIFDWHFTIRGPPDTDFEGGVYHGRIQLPPEWPFKPPSIIFLTENGRFHVGQKICLSISAHHPELWQPAWGIRSILEALISFLPTKVEGGIGGVERSADERKRLAKLSHKSTCPKCGNISDLLEPIADSDHSPSNASTSPCLINFTEESSPTAHEVTEARDGCDSAAEQIGEVASTETPIVFSRPSGPEPSRLDGGSVGTLNQIDRGIARRSVIGSGDDRLEALAAHRERRLARATATSAAAQQKPTGVVDAAFAGLSVLIAVFMFYSVVY